MKYFHLITWKEFAVRKLIDKQEIVNVDDVEDGLKRIKDMNAQKRLTTTDYRTVNLTLLLKDNGLQITGLVVSVEDMEAKPVGTHPPIMSEITD